MPVSFEFLFRSTIAGALGMHVFCMYCLARGLRGQFGFSATSTLIAAVFALAMLVPLVWAVFLPDVPEFFSNFVRPRRRWNRGLCPVCGYRRAGLPPAVQHCPECGGCLIPPAGWSLSSATIRRFVIISAIAWIIGCTAGELWMQTDERDFRREVALSASHPAPVDYARPRRWPNSGHRMRWEPMGGAEPADSPGVSVLVESE